MDVSPVLLFRYFFCSVSMKAGRLGGNEGAEGEPDLPGKGNIPDKA